LPAPLGIYTVQPAADYASVAPGLFVWSLYDPEAKAELSSTAVQTENGLLLVDPVPITDAALDEMTGNEPPIGIVLTNGNHLRGAATFASYFNIPIFAPGQPSSLNELPPLTSWSDCGAADVIRIVHIEGAGPGEVVLHVSRDGGSIVVGDALINFGVNEFAFLPAKYCSDAKRMKLSLRQLLDLQFERILFAHGSPIVTSAKKRVEALLET
jgi:glyoxylase-like metal-dependent hydrolase (beta-lactamase superfamily II)